MIDKDILLQKTNSIQNCLRRIHDTVGADLNRIYQLDAQDVVVLNLQRAVQLVIDMGSYIVAKKGLASLKHLKMYLLFWKSIS